jgi:hypothetical protein
MLNSSEGFFEDFCKSINRPDFVVEIAEFPLKGGCKPSWYPKLTSEHLRRLSTNKTNWSILGSVTKRDFGAGRAGKKDIKSKNYLIFDLDLKDSIGKDALDQMNSQQKKDRIESIFKDKVSAIEQCGLGKLWFAVFSGNGMHLWFRCEGTIPTDDLKLYEHFYLGCQKRLENSLGMKLDDSFQSPAQLIRLPLSYNCKNEPIKTELLHHNTEADSSKELHGIFQETKKTMEEKAQQSTQKPALRVVGSNNDEHKEALRNSLTFEGVLKHKGLSNLYSEGKAQGKEYVIKSPWNDERTPSCYLHLENKVFNDKSSKKKGDIFGFIAELHGLNSRTQFKEVLSIAEDIAGIPSPKIQKVKAQKEESANEVKKTRTDYYKFFEKHLPNICRDILTGQMFFKENNGSWAVAMNALPWLEAEGSEVGLKHAMVGRWLACYGRECLKHRLLVDIPIWDKNDRIKQIATCMILKKGTGLSQEHFEDYLKQWGAKIFEKIEDASVQNESEILLLIGGQGIGKDRLIYSIVGGLGRYYSEGTIGRKENDDYQLAAQSLVINLSEFDQTARTDIGYLKDFITKKEVTFRRPYAREPENFSLHHSLIASSNESDILRDSTGNRRFAPFEIEKIVWQYPEKESLQILAQFKALKGHRVSNDSKKAMDVYIKEKTPPTNEERVLEYFDNIMRSRAPTIGLKSDVAQGIIDEISRNLHINNKGHQIQKILTKNDRSDCGGNARGRRVFLVEHNPKK